jgi:succinate-semialdehyde dehydrogenase/glutarate-semialdehyde dehydrogenase
MPKNILKEGSNETLTLKHKALLQQQGYVDGAWTGARSGKTFDVLNKATHAKIGAVPDMGAEETRAAIAAAAAAFPAWAAQTGKARGDLLTKLFQALQEHAEDLAHIIVAENGKSLAEAKGEMAYSNSFIEWFAAEAQRSYGHTAQPTLPAVRANVITKQPLGVAGLITP